MRKLLLTGLSTLLLSFTYSQNVIVGSKYDIQIYGGINKIFCDVNDVKTTGAGGAGFGMKINNYFKINFDIQHGVYKGGNKTDLGSYFMEFENRYWATSVMGKLYPFMMPFSDVDAFKGLHVGLGVGAHFNNVKAHSSSIQDVGYLNNNNNANLYLPMEIGYSVPLYSWGAVPGKNFQNSVNLLLGYRYNLGFNDSWDGYEPKVEANSHNDGSGTIIIGLGFDF